MITLLQYIHWHVEARDIINFSTFQKHIIQKETSKTLQLQSLHYLNKEPCIYTPESKDKYIVTPSCILKNKLPKLEFTEAVDHIRPYITSFNTVYNEYATTFTYEGTSPIFKKNYDITAKTTNEIVTLAYLQKAEKKLRIDKSALAYNTIKDANFYVVYRDISPLKRCTKQNYFVAANILNDTIIAPGEILNLNKKIANAPGYCKWVWPQNLMFYGWVCGLSTQLFRASLLAPEITITKRAWHSRRLVPYYSEYVYGDDAAMYEMYKQFEIQNTSEYPLYFKLLEKNNGVFLVIITPQKSNEWVTITKQQTNTLSANVDKIIYTQRPELVIGKEHFASRYTKKIYSTW